MNFKILDIVMGMFKPAADLIDEIHTSDHERLIEQRKQFEVQVELLDNVLEYEIENLDRRLQVVKAEAQSEHWLTANWRPITMLTFLAIVVMDYAGQALGSNSHMAEEMWLLIQIGLGGYVAGRSGEKVIKTWKSSNTSS